MRSLGLVGSATAVALAACAPSTVDVTAEAAAVEAAYERYREAVESENLSQVEAAFADGEDAIVFFVGGPRLRGAAAIADGFGSWFAAVDNIRIAPRDLAVRVVSTGQMAWVTYLEDGSLVSEGQLLDWQSRRATLIWEKYGDEWQMVHAHWSDSVPMADTEEGV
jgi:ketosteroid isomerase-like protein